MKRESERKKTLSGRRYSDVYEWTNEWKVRDTVARVRPATSHFLCVFPTHDERTIIESDIFACDARATRRCIWRQITCSSGLVIPSTGLTVGRSRVRILAAANLFIMDARSASVHVIFCPCFFHLFYGRLNWPNGWTDLHETFTRGRY